MSEGFVSVAKVSDFRPDKIRRYFVEGNEVAVVLYKDRFWAFSNLCPHQQFQLHFSVVEDDLVWCPIHYGTFELATGKRVTGPVGICDLPVYPVRLQGDEVQVSLTEPPRGS